MHTKTYYYELLVTEKEYPLKLSYYHVDVFNSQPMLGSGCIVVLEFCKANTKTLQKLAQEMRHYETIFLCRPELNNVCARIFTADEELDYAGHPIIAAAAVLNKVYKKRDNWVFQLNKRRVEVAVKEEKLYSIAVMQQGECLFGEILNDSELEPILKAVSIPKEAVDARLPAQVASTGLSYLFLPVTFGLDKITYKKDISRQLEKFGAKFLYVFDTKKNEGRSFDNKGASEDAATGSAAGPAAAWLHKYFNPSKKLMIRQGSFLGKDSKMFTHVTKNDQGRFFVTVSGSICFIAKGEIFESAIHEK